MDSQEVILLYKHLQVLDIHIWIDGGWGVDALLQTQTRHHEDLDIVIEQKDLSRLRAFLELGGYREVLRNDTTAWNFVLRNEKGNLIDIHVIIVDQQGNGLYGPSENGIMYPASALNGKGKIAGYEVRCLSADYQVISHTGYTLREKDFKDVTALCKKFNIEPPDEYKGSL